MKSLGIDVALALTLITGFIVAGFLV